MYTRMITSSVMPFDVVRVFAEFLLGAKAVFFFFTSFFFKCSTCFKNYHSSHTKKSDTISYLMAASWLNFLTQDSKADRQPARPTSHGREESGRRKTGVNLPLCRTGFSQQPNVSRGRLKMTRVAVTLCVIWLLAAFCAASSGHALLNDSVETIGPRVFLCLYEVRVSICGREITAFRQYVPL